MDDEYDIDENGAAHAIRAVGNGKLAYCKFLSANDTGDTGGHQAGIYVASVASSLCMAYGHIADKNVVEGVQFHSQESSDIRIGRQLRPPNAL
jgi:hypothetical protein